MNADVIEHQVPMDEPKTQNWLAPAIAAVAVAGSVWLSMGMGLKACPLCIYQRTFVMGAFAALAMGLLTKSRANVYALPMAIAAVSVAAFHEYLELTAKLECPLGIAGIGSAPQQALVIQAILLVAVAVGARRSHLMSAALLGLLLAAACVLSAPPMPVSPDKPYDKPIDICRPPYVAKG